MRHRSIKRNSAVASGSSFFNGWRSTPGTTPLTSQLVLLISRTTTKVEIGSNAVRFRLRSLTWATGNLHRFVWDDEVATTSAVRPIASVRDGLIVSLHELHKLRAVLVVALDPSDERPLEGSYEL